MKGIIVCIILGSVSWAGLWQTPAQRGQKALDCGDFEEAASQFEDPMRRGVALYRAGQFEQAEQSFARVSTAMAEFNRGNCLVFRGQYEAAVERFERALELKPGWEDAEINRRIAAQRAEELKSPGGDMGDQKLGADKVVFDRKKDDGGQETEISSEQTISDSAMQALWLRRVQTEPADFLKAKFAYQFAVRADASDAATEEPATANLKTSNPKTEANE